MLRELRDMPPGTIGFEAVGDVDDDDWENGVEPVLRRQIAAGEKVRLLYLLGPRAKDVDGDAMQADTAFRARHASSFERVAVVSDEDWMRPALGALSFLLFWAIIGGLGASLLLPAMQRRSSTATSKAPSRRPTPWRRRRGDRRAVGPLLGGLLTKFLSWRVGFLLEDVVILVVLGGLRLVQDVPYTGARDVDVVGALLSAVGMGGLVVGVLVWQEGGEFVGVLLAVGVIGLGSLARWLVRRKPRASRRCSTPRSSSTSSSGSGSRRRCCRTSRSAAR